MKHFLLFFCLLLLPAAEATAQVVNQGILYIGHTSIVSSGESLTNTGQLVLNGQLALKASFTDAGSLTSIQGALLLTGSAAQTLTSPTAITVSSLTVSNTASGTAIYLQTPLWITQSASFSAGIVLTDATNLLIFADNAQSSSVSNTAHVSGPVRKIGDDSFTFPIGNGTASRPAQLTVQGSTTETYTARYVQNAPPNNSSLAWLIGYFGTGILAD